MSDIWTEVSTLEQLNGFLDRVGGFHDGILKEVHWVNRSNVNEELTMRPCQLAEVRMLVQRQWKDPSAVEMIFQGVRQLQLDPLDFIFGSDAVLEEQQEQEHAGPWLTLRMEGSTVSFKQMRWRDASEWMGTEVRFGSPFVN